MWSHFKNLLLIAGFLAAIPLLAENPPDGALRVYLDLKDSQGLMDFYRSDDIGDKNAQALNNLDFSVNGALRSRRGITSFALPDTRDTNIDMKYMWHSVSTTSTKYFFLKLHGDFVIVPQTNPGAASDQAPLGGANWRGKADFINVNGIPYIVSDATRILKVNEVTPNITYKIVSIPGSPTGSMIKTHLDRMVVAGSTWPGDAMTIYFSSANDYERWPATYFLEINSESNQERITCVGDQIFGNLPVYTNKTTRLITGTEYPTDEMPGNVSVKTISQTIGCAEQRTVKTIKNKQLFYSDGASGNYPGIYEFNGVTVKERTIPYRRFFKDFVVNGSTMPGPIAFVYKDNYCLTVSTVGGIVTGGMKNSDSMICIDDSDRILTNRPTQVGHFIVDITTGYFINNTITGQTSSIMNRIYQYDVVNSTQDEVTPGVFSPLQWSYKTKDFDMGSSPHRTRQKLADRLYIKHERVPVLIKVKANYDFGASSTVWVIDASTRYVKNDKKTVMFSDVDIINRLIIPTGKKFNFVNFEISSSSPATISYLDFYAVPEVMQ